MSRNPLLKLTPFHRRCLGWLLAGGMTVVFLVCVVYGIWASTFDMRDVETIAERSAIYDMDGRYYSRLAGENRVVVPLNKIAPEFLRALLAREDTRFHRHGGIDPLGILRALVRNISHGKIREGGSTLTQQLALNTFLGGRHVRSLHRKVLEAFLSLRIEHNFSKNEILAHYANRIYFGSGYYGVETASQAYFNKPAAKMNLSESAMLVGLIRSPNRFSPFNNLKGAIRQRDAVLTRMLELKMISPAEAEGAQNSRPVIARKRLSVPQENYAMDALRRDLDLILDDAQLDEGGLKIYTTIDPALQRAAQTAVDTQIRKIEARPGYAHPRRSDAPVKPGPDNDDSPPTNYLQGAAVAIDNRTGGIRALVGGRDYLESRFNRALLTKRQIGSTFKPFVYAAAFERGLSPDAPVSDGPIRSGELRAAGNWSPGNSDGTFKGTMPAAEGLIQSRNTMSVRVGDHAGLGEVRRVAEACGLSDVPKVPAIYLGAFEATLKDLTAAYTVFPNEGVRRQCYLIDRIDDADGGVLYRAARISPSVMNPRIAATMNSILTDVLDHGTAATAKSLGFTKPAGGKTGTTNDFYDAWFVGYTKSLTCGVWVGLDRPATIIAKGYGAALALPIWTETMNAASAQRYPATAFAERLREARPERSRDRGRGVEDVPRDIFRSFRKFFGR